MDVRFLDSSVRDEDETALAWLLAHLPNATRVLISSGYFDSKVLDWLEGPLRAVLDRGGDLHFVLGSNRGQTARADLDRVLPLVHSAPTRAALSLVFYLDVLFHPKTYFVRAPGSVAALVGSSNLTVRGLCPEPRGLPGARGPHSRAAFGPN